MIIINRFLQYISIPTQSDPDSSVHSPSTECQFNLARLLVSHMKDIGMEDVNVDDNCYVYGFLNATPGYEEKPCIAFLAHLDTSDQFSGEGVNPQIIENYDGNDVILGSSGKVLSVQDFPHLKALAGRTLITTDGTTLLGADDKAGIAVIIDACERIINENIPHGRIAVAFTPDEEIGSGAELLDLTRLGASFGITVDGDGEDDLSFETFNAASAHWDITGRSVHPGSAKDIMVNALLVGMEINSLLPPDDIPSKTEGYEGFFHLMKMAGDVSSATLDYIIRDHDSDSFNERKNLMISIENLINAKYGDGTVQLTLDDSYYNMASVLKDRMDIIDLIVAAMEKNGISAAISPVRGGTDGSLLSFRGLPCPNIGAGGHAFHGPYEHITLEGMEAATKVLISIIKLNGAR